MPTPDQDSDFPRTPLAHDAQAPARRPPAEEPERRGEGKLDTVEDGTPPSEDNASDQPSSGRNRIDLSREDHGTSGQTRLPGF
jgi:hypothetical protein